MASAALGYNRTAKTLHWLILALANYAMLALVGLHVGAALYHYFVRRDGVLQRMLPGR